MANLKGKGLVLEVGESVSFSDSGEVIETSPIWGTETNEIPIYGDVITGYEWVVDGGNWVQTGEISQTTFDGPRARWFTLQDIYINQNFFPPNVFAETETGAAANFAETFGPSMCGDYKMYSRTGKNNCNAARSGALSTQGVVTGAGDIDPTDDFDGIEIMSVKTYGKNSFNNSWITDMSGIGPGDAYEWPYPTLCPYEFAFPNIMYDPEVPVDIAIPLEMPNYFYPYGELQGWNYEEYQVLNEQVIEFTCRQFSHLSTETGNFAHSRKCHFATLCLGEYGYEGMIYPGDNGWMLADDYDINTEYWEDWTATGEYSDDYKSLMITNEIVHTGLIGYNDELELANDSNYNFFSESQSSQESMSGHESVQGRTLYLYPRKWVMPKIDNGATWYRDDDTASAYEGEATGEIIRWSKPPYDGVLTFDILDAWGDKLFVKGPGDTNLAEWITTIPGVEWDGGSIDEFFSFYHGVVSHWLHGDGFRPNQIWGKANQSDDVENITGLEFNSEYIPPIQSIFEPAPYNLSTQGYHGSYMKTNSGYSKKAFSTYEKRGYLGWRSQSTNWICNDPTLWSQIYGFQIEVKASAFVNCKIEILGDYFTDTERDLMETWIDPGTGENLSGWGQAPYVVHTLTENNQNTQTYIPDAGVTINSAFAHRAYSESNYTPTSQLYNYHIMSAPIRDNSVLLSDEYFYHMQQWLGYHYPGGDFGAEAPNKLSHWEWLRIVPIDSTQPYSVMINEVRVAPAKMQSTTTFEPIYEWTPEYNEVPIFGWGIVDYEYEEVDVITGYLDTLIDAWDITVIKQKWEYLDILDQENIPVSLTYSSGDCKDVKKRNSGYSKTFELPQNKHNQQILNSISATSSYRPKSSIEWRPARIKSNGIYVFNGYARIEQSVSGKGGRYKCHIIEDPSWWPNLIGENKLCDLMLPAHYKTVNTGWSTEETDPITNETTTVTWPTIQQTWDGLIYDGVYGGAYNPNGDFSDNSEQGTGLGYVYPAISYGKWNNMTDEVGVKSVKDFHPAYYIRYLVEQMFQSIGYRIQSDFFTSEHFNRLILPYISGEEYNNVDSMLGEDGGFAVKASSGDYQFWNNVSCDGNNGAFEYGNGSIDNHFSSGFPVYNDRVGCFLPRLSAITDPGGNWVGDPANNNYCTPTGGYIVPFTGYYRMRYDTRVRWSGGSTDKGIVVKWLIKRPTHPFFPNQQRIIHQQSGSIYNTVSYNDNWDTPMIGGNDVVNNILSGNADFNFDFSFAETEPWGNTIPFYEQFLNVPPWGCVDCTTCDALDCNDDSFSWYGNSVYIDDWTAGGGYDDGQGWLSRGMEGIFRLEAGDKINVGYFAVSWGTGSMWVDMKDDQLLIFPEPFADTAPPSVVSAKDVLGCKMKQLDLLKGITEMFNLHWTADNEKKLIYCEPYDDFYGTGKVVDWTSKLDHTSWTDQFIIEDLAKVINYKYKTDGSDGPITEWEEDNEPDFWFSKILTSGELYRKETVDQGTTVFCSTMHLNDRTFNPESWMGGSSKWMPVFWSGEDLLDVIDNENGEFGSFTDDWESIMESTERPDASYNFSPRILNYYGLKQSEWKLDIDGINNTMPNFPSCGAYDYALNGADKFSLDWDDRTAPNGEVSPGLFTKYWKNLHDKISGGASLRTCYVNLNESDISQLDYRDVVKFNIDGVCSYWTINKITDYKPGKEELTKIELIQFDYAPRIESDDEHYAKTMIGPSKNPNYDKKINEKRKRERQKRKKGKGKDIKRRNSARYSVNSSGKRGFKLDNNTSNKIKGTGVAIGHGLSANNSQTVLGKYNKTNKSASLVVGGGYKTKRGYVKKNAITVTKSGDIKYYGGEIVVEVDAGESTSITSVFYTEKNGRTKKLYLNG